MDILDFCICLNYQAIAQQGGTAVRRLYGMPANFSRLVHPSALKEYTYIYIE